MTVTVEPSVNCTGICCPATLDWLVALLADCELAWSVSLVCEPVDWLLLVSLVAVDDEWRCSVRGAWSSVACEWVKTHAPEPTTPATITAPIVNVSFFMPPPWRVSVADVSVTVASSVCTGSWPVDSVFWRVIKTGLPPYWQALDLAHLTTGCVSYRPHEPKPYSCDVQPTKRHALLDTGFVPRLTFG